MKFNDEDIFEPLPPWSLFKLPDAELARVMQMCEGTRNKYADLVCNIQNNMKTIQAEINKRFSKPEKRIPNDP